MHGLQSALAAADPVHARSLAAMLDQALLDLEQRDIRRAADQAEQIVALW
jgi:hypothetical protein